MDSTDADRIPHLPSEILMMILEHLPPSFFQQDLRRLALSKRWYSLAFPVFYPRIEYTPRVISCLVHRKSRALDKLRAQLRKTLRCVNIVLHGLGTGPPGTIMAARMDPDIACFDTPANLARFCVMLHEFRELKAVRFVARWQNRAWHADPLQADYLYIHTLEPYVSLLTHVRSLDLDLCGTDVIDSVGSTVHFCDYIRPLLSRLRTLRLRMRSICHTALWPLEGQPVTLGELTLSVYLGRVSDNNPKLNSSRTCLYWDTQKWASPMDELRARMRALVKGMVEPRRADMVHLSPTGEVHVWDATTGVCVRDESEKPRQFPLCFETRPSCFHKNADDWEWDDDIGIGGIYTFYDEGEAEVSEDPQEESEATNESHDTVEVDGVALA